MVVVMSNGVNNLSLIVIGDASGDMSRSDNDTLNKSIFAIVCILFLL